jgi:hypothetical protein
MNLTDNFTLTELTKSSTATRLGINNTPNSVEIKSLQILCAAILEPARKRFKKVIIPSSGFRSLELNSAIGSSDSSQHVLGEAVDFEIVGVSNYNLAAWIESNLLFDQLILENWTPEDINSGWVHCSYSLAKNRQNVLTFRHGAYKAGLNND